ncbi:MAG: methyltransferase domain-containing protein [Candidatus Gastranaerophilales bacterium]|nr:methyltransferase domain-containing protein [Candidatus Gastranaerophilales bacterium]
MNINDLKINDYVRHFIKEMDGLYSLKDKDVIFMFYEPNIDNARALLAEGAQKVYFINPDYSYKEIENGKIVLLNQYEVNNLKDESVDLIIGLEILEHINDLRWFFDELRRIIKLSGDIELQGNPMWTGPFGHHIWIENKYIFYEESNPFKPWEHLIYNSKEEITKALEEKGLPADDCKEIADWIYNPIEISRSTPTDIIEAVTHFPAGAEKGGISYSRSAMFEVYRTDSWVFSFKRCYVRTEPNEYFELAKQKYFEHDLKTGLFVLKMKKLQPEKPEKDNIEKIDLSNVDTAVSDIIIPFNNKHNVQGKNILNLSAYENELISKIFISLGAKSVTSVNPAENTEKSEYITEYNDIFENIDIADKQFDVIFGLDTLNKITDLDKFCEKLSKAADITTDIYLSGFMPCTSACGHKIFTENHRYTDETNIFDNWEHLTFNTKNDVINSLKAKNVDDNEIKLITDLYYKKEPSEFYTPMQIETAFKKVLNVHMLRIYHYYKQNNFYKLAAEKFSEDDLNTERIIITSDLPTLYWLHELNMNPYLEAGISDINMKYVLDGKRVLNLTPYIQYPITEGLEALRAKEVVSLDSHYSGFELRGGKNVVRVNQKVEDIENLPGKFDIIYGLDVLEHIKDVKKFFINLGNLITDKGVICLSGSPLWPSDNGHNCSLQNLDCGYLRTGEGSPCLESWEHLAYENQQDLKQAMITKGFTEHDAAIVSDYIFNSDEINRLSFSDFINLLNELDYLVYGSKKILNYTEENEFYTIASSKYTHEELRTKELKLYIRKKPH